MRLSVVSCLFLFPSFSWRWKVSLLWTQTPRPLVYVKPAWLWLAARCVAHSGTKDTRHVQRAVFVKLDGSRSTGLIRAEPWQRGWRRGEEAKREEVAREDFISVISIFKPYLFGYVNWLQDTLMIFFLLHVNLCCCVFVCTSADRWHAQLVKKEHSE